MFSIRSLSPDDYLQLKVNLLGKVQTVQKVSEKVALYSLPVFVFFGVLCLFAEEMQRETQRIILEENPQKTAFHKRIEAATFLILSLLTLATISSTASNQLILKLSGNIGEKICPY